MCLFTNQMDSVFIALNEAESVYKLIVFLLK